MNPSAVAPGTATLQTAALTCFFVHKAQRDLPEVATRATRSTNRSICLGHQAGRKGGMKNLWGKHKICNHVTSSRLCIMLVLKFFSLYVHATLCITGSTDSSSHFRKA